MVVQPLLSVQQLLLLPAPLAVGPVVAVVVVAVEEWWEPVAPPVVLERPLAPLLAWLLRQ